MWDRRGLPQLLFFYLAPLFNEYLPPGLGLVPIFAGVFSVLVAESLVWRVNGAPIWKGLCLLLGAYIQSVYIYNLFDGRQHMNFFGPGWTA